MPERESRRQGIAFWGTALWLALVFGYVFGHVGWDLFWTGKPSEHGDFFAGAAAPLAFFWLVVGYFQQGAEIRQNTRALRQQAEELKRAAEQAEKQALAISANERHARRDTFFRVAELYERELNNYVAEILARLKSDKIHSRFWERFGHGDRFVFAREILKILAPDETMDAKDADRLAAVFAEREIRSASRRNVKVFERILAESDDYDEAGAIRAEFEWSPLGEVYGRLAALLDKVPVFAHRSPKSMTQADPPREV